MRSHKKILVLGGLVAVLGSACYCATITGTVNGADGAPFQGAFVALPLYVAQAFKLFEKHGIEAELIYGTGIQVTNILVGGSSDFGAFAIEHGVTILGKGQDIKLLVVAQSAPRQALVAHELAGLLPRRNALSYKGDFGKLAIVAGSPGFTGAPVLCAQASLAIATP